MRGAEMELRKENRERVPFAICGVVLFAALFLLCRTFPIVGDDWFRETLGASLHGPIDLAREVAARWATVNGRILGNVLAYSAGSRPILREGMRALFTLALAALLARVTQLKGWQGLLLCAFGVLALPREMFAQIYPWAAGFFNYVPPVVMLLGCLELVRPVLDGDVLAERPGRASAVFLLGFGQQLFIENNTLYALCASLVLLIWYGLERRKWSPCLLAFFLGCALGAALLFASPSYRLIAQDGGAYQSGLGGGLAGLLAAARENLPEVTQYFLLGHPLPHALLVILVLTHWRRGGRRTQMDWLLAALLVLGIPVLSRSWVVTAVWWLAFAAALWRWMPGRPCQGWTLFLWLSAPAAAGPLLFVNPIGPRCLFLSYVLVLAVLGILLQSMKPGRWLTPAAAVLAVGIFCYCFGIFLPLHKVEEQRTQIIQEALNSGRTEVAIPAYHHDGWLWDADNAPKMEQFYFQKQSGDLRILFES